MVQKYPPTNFMHSCLYCFLPVGMVFSQKRFLTKIGANVNVEKVFAEAY